MIPAKHYMGSNKDLYKLIKLTEPSLARYKDLIFKNPQAECLGRGILKMRSQIRHLARELNRSLSNEGQIHEYLKDLIAFQELIRELGPLRNTDSVMTIVLQLSIEIMNGDGSIFYLWGAEPTRWVKEKSFKVSGRLEAAIEGELERQVIIDGSERQTLIIPFNAPGGKGEGWLILVPLVSGNRQMGVFIGLVEISHLKYFGYHINVFDMFGRAVAIAMENAVLYEAVERLSERDDLTSLYNARYPREFITKALSRTSYKKPLALLFMDLDNFKRVNDSRGHMCGSRVLAEVAEIFEAFSEGVHCACRYGGDEFILGLLDTNLEKALEIAEKVRFEIEIKDFDRESGLRLNLTISIGIALFPNHASTTEELINLADMAMYKAKTQEKNNVCVWQGSG